MGEYSRVLASDNGSTVTVECRSIYKERIVKLLHEKGYHLISVTSFDVWDPDRMFLVDTDSKSFHGEDEPYKKMSLDWELFEAFGMDNETDHYEVWIDGRWSENFDTEVDAREYIRAYGG